MWDDLEGVTERRAALPGPVAVLNNFMGVEIKRERQRPPPTRCSGNNSLSTSTCSNSETRLEAPTIQSNR